MPHDPPTGKELKVLKSFESEYKRIYRKIDTTTSRTYTDLDFAKEGVRCNGRQRLVTVIDAWDDILKDRDNILLEIKNNERYLELVDRLIRRIHPKIDSLEICPTCKGKKGWKDNTHGEDCPDCEGRGIIDGS